MKSLILKLNVLVLLFLSLFMSSFGADIVVTNCPTFVSGNNYIFNGVTSDITCNVNVDDVSLTSNGVYQDHRIAFRFNGIDNVTISNLNVKNSYFEMGGTNTNFNISNNKFHEIEAIGGGTGYQISGLFSGGLTQSNVWTNFTIHDNFFQNKDTLSASTTTLESPCSSLTECAKIYGAYNPTFASTPLTMNNFDVKNNDFLNFEVFGGAMQTNVNLNSYISENNIYGVTKFGSGTISIPTDASCNVSFTNDMLGWADISGDANLDKIADTTTILSSGSCNYVNYALPIQKDLNHLPDTKAFMYTMPTANYYDSATSYYLAIPLFINSSNYISFENSQFSELILPRELSLSIQSTNSLRLGTNNKVRGLFDDIFSVGNKAGIRIDNSLNVAYNQSNEYATNWQLITTGNNVEMDNLKFSIQATEPSNFGLIRPKTNQEGRDFKFTNNKVTYLTTMSNNQTPAILFGTFSKIKGNTFNINNEIQFALGTARSIANPTEGGLIIQDNTFLDSPQTFQKIVTQGVQSAGFVSFANHNEFVASVGLTSLPFHPTNINSVSDATFKLNGAYLFEQICDSYEFDVGNWYQDIDDSGLFNDSDVDGIWDTGSLRSDPSTNLFDNRMLVNYPYDFASNTGSIVPEDLCGSFTFNVNTPTNNTNYNLSAGQSLTIDWSFTSSQYTPMTCFVNINDYQELIMAQNSGQVYQKSFEFLTGAYNFEVTCENEFILFSSGNYNFTINEGTIFESVPQPTAPVLGCTDPQANNYNPSATQDDGSCTFDNGGTGGTGGTGQGSNNGIIVGSVGADGFFSGDIGESKDSVVTMFSLFETPLAWGYLIGFLLIGLAFVSLMIMLVRALVGA